MLAVHSANGRAADNGEQPRKRPVFLVRRFFDVLRDMRVDFPPFAAVTYNDRCTSIIDLVYRSVGRGNRTSLERSDHSRIAVHSNIEILESQVKLDAFVKVRL